MTLWFVFALMTAGAAFAVLWPLGRPARRDAGGSESVVYRDQLAEIEHDAEAGQIGAPEAAAARVEIGRRLLEAADAESNQPRSSHIGSRRAVAIAALAGIPLLALAIYLPLGSPGLPDFPLAERAREATASQPLDNLVAQVESHLEQNPADGRGWAVLAPVLVRCRSHRCGRRILAAARLAPGTVPGRHRGVRSHLRRSGAERPDSMGRPCRQCR